MSIVPRFVITFRWDCGCNVEAEVGASTLEEAIPVAVHGLVHAMREAREMGYTRAPDHPDVGCRLLKDLAHEINIVTPSGLQHRGEAAGMSYEDPDDPRDSAWLN